MQVDLRSRYLWVAVFAVAFAFVEASVVVYLRSMYYPGGFDLPLRQMQNGHLTAELIRELATMVMLIAVAMTAGGGRWERFGFFLVAFGIWDIFFYLWLKMLLDWPATLTDWDVLFLLPFPWIGPVIAPLLIALLMTACGSGVVLRIAQGKHFRPRSASWACGVIGTLILLASFMTDTVASFRNALPHPYRYELLAFGLVLWIVAFLSAIAPARRSSR